MITLAIAGFSVVLGVLGIDHVRQQSKNDSSIPAANAANSSPSAPASLSDPKQKPSESQPNDDPLALNAEQTLFFRLIEQRDTGSARIRLKKHMSLHPNDGKAAFLFGLSYHREQKYGSAVPWYQKALALSPEYYLTRHFQGWALYYLGELEQARAAFEEFLKHQPDEPDSNYALGLISLDEDNLPDAEARLKRAIELGQAKRPRPDPKDLSKAHARLGEVFERQDKLTAARAHLAKSVELYPDHYEALYKLYRVLVRLNEQEEAQRVHKLYLFTKERVRPGTSFPE